jgi:hypothetical protein
MGKATMLLMVLMADPSKCSSSRFTRLSGADSSPTRSCLKIVGIKPHLESLVCPGSTQSGVRCHCRLDPIILDILGLLSSDVEHFRRFSLCFIHHRRVPQQFQEARNSVLALKVRFTAEPRLRSGPSNPRGEKLSCLDRRHF